MTPRDRDGSREPHNDRGREATMPHIADLVFKAAVLAILAVFLYLYATSRDVGRYAYYREGDLEYVLDTATGVVYQGGYFMNHRTGQEGPVRK